MAHADTLERLTIDEDKKFLMTQREEGRCGCMGAADKVQHAKEQQIKARKAKEEERRRRLEEAEPSTAVLNSSTSSSSCNTEDESEREDPLGPVEEVVNDPLEAADGLPPKRAKKNAITPGLAAALDRTKMTDRGAVFILTGAARSFGV